MDSWKAIRLWVCVAGMLAIFVVCMYARLRWGVSEYPYGGYGLGAWSAGREWFTPRTPDPFRDMYLQMTLRRAPEPVESFECQYFAPRLS
jgi:hypothetical protein